MAWVGYGSSLFLHYMIICLILGFWDLLVRHGVGSILSTPHQIYKFQFKMYQFHFLPTTFYNE